MAFPFVTDQSRITVRQRSIDLVQLQVCRSYPAQLSPTAPRVALAQPSSASPSHPSQTSRCALDLECTQIKNFKVDPTRNPDDLSVVTHDRRKQRHGRSHLRHAIRPHPAVGRRTSFITSRMRIRRPFFVTKSSAWKTWPRLMALSTIGLRLEPALRLEGQPGLTACPGTSAFACL